MSGLNNVSTTADQKKKNRRRALLLFAFVTIGAVSLFQFYPKNELASSALQQASNQNLIAAAPQPAVEVPNENAVTSLDQESEVESEQVEETPVNQTSMVPVETAPINVEQSKPIEKEPTASESAEHLKETEAHRLAKADLRSLSLDELMRIHVKEIPKGFMRPNGIYCQFRTYRGDTHKAIDGSVELVNHLQKKIAEYPSNKAVIIPTKQVTKEAMLLQCAIVGYRKVEKMIDLEEISKMDTIVTVPFELVPLQKGEHAVLYHVYFFTDAAVMRPESKYEINTLLAFMKEHPEYKITIHGHTNSNQSGKILEMPKDTKSYFSLSAADNGYGTAKKLSEKRAELIRTYLIDHGIAPERMEVKAWGGTRPIYDKHSAQAQLNVRVAKWL